VFLLVAAWLFCAIPATAALSAFLSVLGVGKDWDWFNTFCWFTGLFAFASLVFGWCFVRGLRALRRS